MSSAPRYVIVFVLDRPRDPVGKVQAPETIMDWFIVPMRDYNPMIPSLKREHGECWKPFWLGELPCRLMLGECRRYTQRILSGRKEWRYGIVSRCQLSTP